MLLLLASLIPLIKSGINFQGTTLTITDVASISYNDLRQYSTATTCTISYTGTFTVGQQSFQGFNSLNDVTITAPDVVLDQQAFQQCTVHGTFKIDATNTITMGQSAFVTSSINQVYLSSSKDITIGQQAMQQVTNFNNLVVKTNGNVIIGQTAFISSQIKKFNINCGGTATFQQQAYQQTGELNEFNIVAGQGITFAITSFISSNVNSMTLKTNGEVNFGQQSFQECKNLRSVVIDSASNVVFGNSAFIASQIQELRIQWVDHVNNGKMLAQSSTITFESQSFSRCNQLTDVDINTKGNVNVGPNSFESSEKLKHFTIKADGKATVGANAFKDCKELDKAKIDASEKDIADDAYGDKKSGSSSHKDSDDLNEKSAKALGNIKIQSVYLGTSPNIVVNLNIFAQIMHNARKVLGHVLPPPDFVHTAIWVGEENAGDDTLGAIFAYGKYHNRYHTNSYLGSDGAKAYVMKLGDFKKKYPSINPMKLNPKKEMKLYDFIDAVKASGNWGVHDYNWPTNNCQHFTAKMIDVLHATRDAPRNEDWIDLPKPVMNSLVTNEK